MFERLLAFQLGLRYLNLVCQLEETLIKYTKFDSTRFSYTFYDWLLLGFTYRSNVRGIWICAATNYGTDQYTV
jgi:hypothetical protein